MKKIIAVIVPLSFILCISGCATTAADGRKTELRTTEFQNTLGAALVITGMAGGAVIGGKMSNGSDGQNLTYGILGGIIGTAAVGGAYWLFLNIVGERVPVDDKDEEPKVDIDVLMPK